MTTSITLREYGDWTLLKTVVSIEDQSDFLAAWGEENERLTSELGFSHSALATRFGRNVAIRAQGIAGIIRISNYVVKIIPKCLTAETVNWERGLLRMLSFSESLQFELSAPIDVDVEPEATDIVDHVAYSFALELETALHSGPLLIYQEREVLSPYARGHIQLEPITDLFTHPQLLRCVVEEMDIQNPYTGLLCWTLETLQRASRKPELQARLQALRANFIGVTPWLLSPSLIDHLNLPIQYKQYEAALSIAKWLAIGETLGQIAGDRIGGGLILDMARVFEKFVGACLRAVSIQNSKGGKMYTTISQKSEQLAVEVGGSKPIITRPDEQLFENGQLTLIADAKYKGRSGDNPANFLLSDNDDLYQMLATCTATGCSRAMLIYPAIDEVITMSSSSKIRQWHTPNNLGGRDVLFTATALDIRELASTGINTIINNLNKAVTSALNSS